MGELQSKEIKFYNKSWFMWLMCFFIAPVGLFIMWKNKRLNVIARLLLAFVFVVIFLGEIGAIVNPTPTTQPVATKIPPNQSASVKPKQIGSSKKVSNDPNTQQKAKLKKQAEQAYAAFNKLDKQYMDTFNAYRGQITGISNGSIDQVTGYSNLKQLSDISLQVFSNISDMDVPNGYSEEKDAYENAASYLHSSIKDLMSWLDNNKVSTMSDATDELKQSDNIHTLATIKLVGHVMTNGYLLPKEKVKRGNKKR